MPPLEARNGQLVATLLPAISGNGARAVRAAPGDFFHGHLARLAVGNAHQHHAEVEQRGVKTGNGRLLAAMLRVARRENTADLVLESAFGPQRPQLVEEIAHLPTHVAVTRRRTEDDRVRLDQLLWRRHGNVGKRRPRRLGAGFLEYAIGNQLGYLQQRYFGAFHLARPGRDRFRHGVDVTVHGIENDLDVDLHHGLLALDWDRIIITSAPATLMTAHEHPATPLQPSGKTG